MRGRCVERIGHVDAQRQQRLRRPKVRERPLEVEDTIHHSERRLGDAVRPRRRDDAIGTVARIGGGKIHGGVLRFDKNFGKLILLRAEVAEQSGEMRRLAKLNGTEDSREAFARYREWLPFARRATHATRAVSLDLDYQPMLRI